LLTQKPTPGKNYQAFGKAQEKTTSQRKLRQQKQTMRQHETIHLNYEITGRIPVSESVTDICAPRRELRSVKAQISEKRKLKMEQK